MIKKYLFLSMTISDIISVLEKMAPTFLQEDYDNAGLIIGDRNTECSGVLLALDTTEEIIKEAKAKNCNLIIAHHPIVFRGLKRINGRNYVERAVISAIKNDVAVYASHTNLDNVIDGVNGKLADKLELINRTVLSPKGQLLMKLTVYVPESHFQILEQALFNAGGGNLGNYSECSFVSEGVGSFKPGENADPFSGEIGKRQFINEKKIELVFPLWLQSKVITAMKSTHPYEEVAYELTTLENTYQQTGSGLLGELSEAMEESSFLNHLATITGIKVVRHTPLLGKKIKKVAICGGAGSFLTTRAISSGADIFVTSDVKYHEFFDADGEIVLADIGHFESEQFTIDLFYDVLRQNFPNFAVLKTELITNPVRYFLG